MQPQLPLEIDRGRGELAFNNPDPSNRIPYNPTNSPPTCNPIGVFDWVPHQDLESLCLGMRES